MSQMGQGTTGQGSYGIPGMGNERSAQVAQLLQGRLTALIDMELTLKHIHWNVVGPSFIGVHEMLDPQVAAVREMVDDVAERIATLGGTPIGTPGFITQNRTWDDYSILRGTTQQHLGALDQVYNGLIEDHRACIEATDELDPVTNDMLIEQSGQLEQFQWFVRAHLENTQGQLVTEGTSSEKGAAKQATEADHSTLAAPGAMTR
jgi:starvation-inducible DNA-binding protein